MATSILANGLKQSQGESSQVNPIIKEKDLTKENLPTGDQNETPSQDLSSLDWYEAMQLILKEPGQGTSCSQTHVAPISEISLTDQLLSNLRLLTLNNSLDFIVSDPTLIAQIQSLFTDLEKEGAMSKVKGLSSLKSLVDGMLEMKSTLIETEQEKFKLKSLQNGLKTDLADKAKNMSEFEDKLARETEALIAADKEIEKWTLLREGKMKEITELNNQKSQIEGQCKQLVENYQKISQDMSLTKVKSESIITRMDELRKNHAELMKNPPF